MAFDATRKLTRENFRELPIVTQGPYSYDDEAVR